MSATHGASYVEGLSCHALHLKDHILSTRSRDILTSRHPFFRVNHLPDHDIETKLSSYENEYEALRALELTCLRNINETRVPEGAIATTGRANLAACLVCGLSSVVCPIKISLVRVVGRIERVPLDFEIYGGKVRKRRNLAYTGGGWDRSSWSTWYCRLQWMLLAERFLSI